MYLLRKKAMGQTRRRLRAHWFTQNDHSVALVINRSFIYIPVERGKTSYYRR